MNVICIIPARLQSMRLPKKLLMQMGTSSIIEHVYRNCVNAGVFSTIIIAVDDIIMFDHCKRFCDQVIMTRTEHSSGTDRIFEAYSISKVKADYIVNVQADEPFLEGVHIAQLVHEHVNTTCDVMTAMSRIYDADELHSPSCVKVVVGNNHRALYFSRSPIPFIRDIPMNEWLNHHAFMKHIGIYSYTESSLQKFIEMPLGTFEQVEKLEQLRLLEEGLVYSCIELQYDGFGIDTLEDYHKALERLNRE